MRATISAPVSPIPWKWRRSPAPWRALLAIDEDLAEAVSLAHDLGHTPFGHAGEEALNAATQNFGGFDHNAHALKLVTCAGAPLCRFRRAEPHLGDAGRPRQAQRSDCRRCEARAGADRVVRPALAARTSTWPGLEAQVAALADDIAYVNHDIDDGLRAASVRGRRYRARAAGGRYRGGDRARYGSWKPAASSVKSSDD